MKLLPRVAFAAACLLLAGSAPLSSSSGGAIEMPQILYRATADHPWPEFIAANAAVDSKGELYESLMYPSSVRDLKQLFSYPPIADCIPQEETYVGANYGHDRGTLEAALSNSPLVIHGRMAGRQPGFRFSTAGQLIGISVIDSFGVELPHQDYYFFLPVGEFTAGPYKICKTDSGFGPPPASGDEVLLMIPRFESLADQFLNIDDNSSLVVFYSEGQGFSLPAWHQHESNSFVSRQQILDLARQVTRTKRAAKP